MTKFTLFEQKKAINDWYFWIEAEMTPTQNKLKKTQPSLGNFSYMVYEFSG